MPQYTIMKRIILALLIGFHSPTLWSQQGVSPEKKERERFLKLYKGLNLRYEGFFEHMEEEKQRRLRRQAGAEAQREKRQRAKESYEKARIKFVANRREKPNNDAARLAHEAKIQRKLQLFEQAREAYIIHRDKLHHIRDTAKRIPGNLELGLEEK